MVGTKSFACFCLCLLVCAYAKEESMSKVCLGCICDAASNCNTTIGCSGEVCGPFRITPSYWADGGKPTLDGESASDDNAAFTNCVNDAYCAARTVQGYMQKYTQDCNGDGAINCDDYARIHQLGGYGCTGAFDPTFESTYSTCFKAFQ